MKNTFVLLGVIASVVVPLSAQADSESPRSGDTSGRVKSQKAATHAQSNRYQIYVTSQKVTGSHIPLVVSRYNGQYYSSSPTAVYGRPNLDRTGQLNVQGELYQNDPAISSVGVGGLRR